MSLVRDYPPLWDAFDRPGSRTPRKFSAMTWMSHPVVRQAFALFDKEVPADFWSEDVEAAETIAIISCPCGEEPHIALHHRVFCTGCDRVFWNLGDTIKVARNPDVEPEAGESSPDGRTLEGDAREDPTKGD